MIKGLSNYFLMDILNKLVTFNGVFSIDNIPSSVLLKNIMYSYVIYRVRMKKDLIS